MKLETSPRVLVTGGTGFLGSHLVDRLLAAGRRVTVASRRPQPALEARGVRVVVGSLHDAAVCTEAIRGAGTVYHTAARVGVWGRYRDFHRDNVVATEVLLAAARGAGVDRFVYTSTPSVVYHGGDLSGADESLPLTTACPSPYPLTKAIAERTVRAAQCPGFRTVALRPHLIWGIGDPHLVPRLLDRARRGRLRIVGSGRNRVDMVHITNAVDAHLAAEAALMSACHLIGDKPPAGSPPPAERASTSGSRLAGASKLAAYEAPPGEGRAYFITNGEPVVLWEWINGLLVALGERPVTARVPLKVATALGACCEAAWRALPLRGEPPMTRFVAAELAKDHWFSIEAARRGLGYTPRVTMAEGTAELVAHLSANKPPANSPG